MQRILSFFKGNRVQGIFSPQALTLQRWVKILLVFGGGAFLLLLLVQFSVKKSRPPKAKTETVVLDSALDAVSSKERWANRLTREANDAKDAAKSAQKEALAALNEQKVLAKKVDVLESVLESLTTDPLTPKKGEKGGQHIETTQKNLLNKPQKFPAQGPYNTSSSYPEFENTDVSRGGMMQVPEGIAQDRPKILHLSLKVPPRKRPQTVDSYVPSATHARGILLSGLAVSTALSTQSDPQPIMIRLLDHGTIPGGFSSNVKDAVLIGACHGELSAERAFCRLVKMTITEKNGEVLERKVQGWILGEDGRPGLRGDIVDRAGDVARNAMIAGILGGMSKFLENQATRSVFPVSPFGQSNALAGKQMIAGGAASGAANAFEKLAEFSIKRAEAMQPVIMVSSGRIIDVVFNLGLDLSESTERQELKLIGKRQREDHAKSHARQEGIQLQ